MANEENLIPYTSEQSHEEAVKNGRKGGIESGKSRRRKKLLKETVEMLLNLPVHEGELDEITCLDEVNGKNITVQEMLVLKQIARASKGDLKAFNAVVSLVSESIGAKESGKDEEKEKSNLLESIVNSTKEDLDVNDISELQQTASADTNMVEQTEP